MDDLLLGFASQYVSTFAGHHLEGEAKTGYAGRIVYVEYLKKKKTQEHTNTQRTLKETGWLSAPHS